MIGFWQTSTSTVTIRIQDQELRAILDRADELAERTARELEERLQRQWSAKVFADAQVMVPVEFATLEASGQVTLTPGGFRIEYGGLASEYAERQHEDDRLRHNPPSGKYSYEAGSGIGEWNPPRGSGIVRTVVSSLKTRKQREVWSQGRAGGKGWWRYQKVKYGRRSLRISHPIKPTAVSHWLYGAEYSAYDANLQAMLADLKVVGMAFAERYLHGAA